jgi:capsular polysaccharide biosynthesis protein
MEFNDFLGLLRRKKQTIITIILVVTMMTVLVSLTQPLKYGVSSRLLVTQNADTADAYSLSRSNEYLGGLLAEVVYSGSFYDQVINSQYKVDKNYFQGDYGKQIKKWQKTIETKTKQDTGIIEINVYHSQVSEAKKIALAVNDILINKNQDYHGGRNVEINIIDQPLASNYPVKPNLIFNGLSAVALALLFSLFYIYIFPEEKYSLYLFGKSNKKKYNKKKIINNLGEISLDKDLEYEEIKEDFNTQNTKDDDAPEELKGNIQNIIR